MLVFGSGHAFFDALGRYLPPRCVVDPLLTQRGGRYLLVVSVIPFSTHLGGTTYFPVASLSLFDATRRYLPPRCVSHFFFDALGRFLPPRCVVDPFLTQQGGTYLLIVSVIPFLTHRGGQHLPVVSLIPFRCSEEVLASHCVGHLFFDALGRL